MTDEFDVTTMTKEQTQELSVCLRRLVKQLIPRLPDEFHEGQLKESLIAVQEASRGQDVAAKLIALDQLTRIIMRTSGFYPKDPLGPTFVRSMELLCKLGLAERCEVNMDSEEGRMLHEQHALRTAEPASDAIN